MCPVGANPPCDPVIPTDICDVIEQIAQLLSGLLVCQFFRLCERVVVVWKVVVEAVCCLLNHEQLTLTGLLHE